MENGHQWSWKVMENAHKAPFIATQLNSTASCRSADGASAVLNVVTQLK